MNLNLLQRNYAMSGLGLKKGESCKAAGAPPQTPMGALAPPYLLVWGLFYVADSHGINVAKIHLKHITTSSS